MPTCTASNAYRPVSFVTVVKATPVASLVSVTVAPGTFDPERSVMIPVTREVVPLSPADARHDQQDRERHERFSHDVFSRMSPVEPSQPPANGNKPP